MSFATAACQTQDAYTDEKKTSNATKGAVIGAVGGAAVGALTNKNQGGKNALIGAGIGAAVGGGIGYYMDRQEEELRKELRSAGVSVERRGDTITCTASRTRRARLRATRSCRSAEPKSSQTR